MIFTIPHIELIRQGRKVETRRLGPRPRWLVGHVHPVKRNWFAKPDCWIRILSVHADRLGNIDQAGVEAEGYSSLDSYRVAWERIFKQPWDDDTPIWVVRFCLSDGPEKLKQSTLFDVEGVL